MGQLGAHFDLAIDFCKAVHEGTFFGDSKLQEGFWLAEYRGCAGRGLWLSLLLLHFVNDSS